MEINWDLVIDEKVIDELPLDVLNSILEMFEKAGL